jgi:hypothetical protein
VGVPVYGLDARGLFLLCLDAFALAFIVLHGLTRNYDDSDRGSGNVVNLDPPLRPSYLRCGLFLGVSFLVSVLLVGLRRPDLSLVYSRLVGDMMGSALHDPAAISAYTHVLVPVFQANVLAFGIAFAVAFRSSLARRLMILFNIALGLAASALVDTLFGLLSLESHFPFGPTPLINILLQYLIAGFIVLRLEFTSFQLPRKTPIPLFRGKDWGDDLVLVICVAVAAVATAGSAVWIADRFPGDPAVTTVIAFSCAPWFFLCTTLALGAVRLVSRRRVNPGPERPPIEVIIPAYNEDTVIARLRGTGEGDPLRRRVHRRHIPGGRDGHGWISPRDGGDHHRRARRKVGCSQPGTGSVPGGVRFPDGRRL